MTIQTQSASQKIAEFKCPLVPCGKFGWPYLGKPQQPQEQHYIPIPISVCSIFLCPNNGVAANVWHFKSVCTCKQLHTVAVWMML